MRGLKNNGRLLAPLGPPLLPWDLMAQNHTQNHTWTDMVTMTQWAQWGRFSEKYLSHGMRRTRNITAIPKHGRKKY